MTDNDIIKALERCATMSGSAACEGCPMDNRCIENSNILNEKVFDLINRQRAEIEDLKDSNEHLAVFLEEARAEIERLKEEIADFTPINKLAIQDKKNMMFETGDYAKIARNESSHEFEIGTIVKLEKKDDDYKAFADGDWWWVTDDDLEKVGSDNLVKEMTEGTE